MGESQACRFEMKKAELCLSTQQEVRLDAVFPAQTLFPPAAAGAVPVQRRAEPLYLVPPQNGARKPAPGLSSPNPW